MNINTAVRNMSSDTLTRLAQKVEHLHKNRSSDGSIKMQTKEDEDMFNKIVNEAHQHSPHPCAFQFSQARSAYRQHRIANGTVFDQSPIIQGSTHGFALNDDGGFTIFKSAQERDEHNRQWTKNLIESLMEAITAMRATNPQSNLGGAFDASV